VSGEGGTGPGDLTRTTVWLTPPSVVALNAAEQLTRDSRTDVVNRALQVYAALAAIGTHEGTYRLSLDVGGRPLYVAAGRTAPKRRWQLW